MEETKIQKFSQTGEITPEQRKLLCATYFKGANEVEVQLCLMIAAKYNLDPFAREIFYVPQKDKAGNWKPGLVMIARDGYLAIARRNNDFAGLVSGPIYEGMDFEVDFMDGTVKASVTSEMLGNRKPPIGAWAAVKKTDGQISIKVVRFSEFNRPGQGFQSTWDKHPSTMITKVAESQVLRQAYGISGTVSPEEMGFDEHGDAIETTASRVEKALNAAPQKTESTGRRLHSIQAKPEPTKVQEPTPGAMATAIAESIEEPEIVTTTEAESAETAPEVQTTAEPETPAASTDFLTYCKAVRVIGEKVMAKIGRFKAGQITKGRKLEALTREEVEEIEMAFTEILAGGAQ